MQATRPAKGTQFSIVYSQFSNLSRCTRSLPTKIFPNGLVFYELQTDQTDGRTGGRAGAWGGGAVGAVGAAAPTKPMLWKHRPHKR